MLKKVCDLIEQFIFRSIVRKCWIENLKSIEYWSHRKNREERSICLTIRCVFEKFSDIVNMFNIECWCEILLEDSCCFWSDNIEFNIETKKTRSFVSETDMISQCFRREQMISILSSCRNIERRYEKSEELIWDLNFERYQFHHECWRVEIDLLNQLM